MDRMLMFLELLYKVTGVPKEDIHNSIDDRPFGIFYKTIMSDIINNAGPISSYGIEVCTHPYFYDVSKVVMPGSIYDLEFIIDKTIDYDGVFLINNIREREMLKNTKQVIANAIYELAWYKIHYPREFYHSYFKIYEMVSLKKAHRYTKQQLKKQIDFHTNFLIGINKEPRDEYYSVIYETAHDYLTGLLLAFELKDRDIY